MVFSPSPIDWHEIADEQRGEQGGASPRSRLRWLQWIYAAGLAIVLLRAVQLELSDGPGFRELASRPVEKQVTLVAERGRILARDGTVLAADREARALALHYRYLQSPPDKRWLRRQARERLTRAQRRDPEALAAAEKTVREELVQMQRRLAAMCGIAEAQWTRRSARIERRVEQLAESINRRRREQFVEQTSTVTDDAPLGVTSILAGLFAPPEQLPPAEMLVAEQAAYHRIVDELPGEVAAAIERTPAAFPGVKVVRYTRRAYPQAAVAANVLGHVGTPSTARATLVKTSPEAEATTVVGLLGIEDQFETKLSGGAGTAIRVTSRQGDVLETRVKLPPRAGRDVVLTLDVELQRFAEQLLDRFAQRTGLSGDDEAGAKQGGALLVIDVQTGEVLTAATRPRFDPNWFASGDPGVEAVLSDAGQPLFDRATRMAIPPGSVFKPLTALALLEHGIVRADTKFTCQGYLADPDRMRCQMFRRHGVGHGDVTLADALAQSCNVYFFHYARALRPEDMIAWSRRMGIGRESNGDPASQVASHVPTLEELDRPGAMEFFSIGQGTLTVTPLEVLVLYAAIANGGFLLEPTFTRADVAQGVAMANGAAGSQRGTRIEGLDPATLAAVRVGLERVVQDAAGTAFETVRIPDLPIAGKTGTAETGGDEGDHAWFAGYAPASDARVAFVVAIEHGGSGSTAAGTIAKHLVERMRQLGYFGETRTAENQFPPGKG